MNGTPVQVTPPLPPQEAPTKGGHPSGCPVDVVLNEQQQALVHLLCEFPDMAMVEVMKIMGISRSWLYDLRDQLTALTVFHPAGKEFSPSDQEIHFHRAVRLLGERHVWWSDGMGEWIVQTSTLDRWDRKHRPYSVRDERIILVKRCTPDIDKEWLWTANRRHRYTTLHTATQLYSVTEGGWVTGIQLCQLTREIAWALESDGVTPPVKEDSCSPPEPTK